MGELLLLLCACTCSISTSQQSLLQRYQKGHPGKCTLWLRGLLPDSGGNGIGHAQTNTNGWGSELSWLITGITFLYYSNRELSIDTKIVRYFT